MEEKRYVGNRCKERKELASPQKSIQLYSRILGEKIFEWSNLGSSSLHSYLTEIIVWKRKQDKSEWVKPSDASENEHWNTIRLFYIFMYVRNRQLNYKVTGYKSMFPKVCSKEHSFCEMLVDIIYKRVQRSNMFGKLMDRLPYWARFLKECRVGSISQTYLTSECFSQIAF